MEARKTRARKSRRVDEGKAYTEEDATASSEASEGAASDSLSGADSQYEFFTGLLPVSGEDDVRGA